MQLSFEFIATSLIVVVSPGPGALLTIASGLTQGARTSMITALGCTLGIVPHLLAALLGLAVVFHTSVYAFNLLKWLGVIYLLYMAWMTWRERGALRTDVEPISRSPLRIIQHAVFINLFNPKLPLFFLAFLPQFIATDSVTPARDMLLLSTIFMVLTLLTFMLYGAFAAMMRRRVLEQPQVMHWIRRLFALSFVGLSIKLLVTSR